jgi:hypothetical protein
MTVRSQQPSVFTQAIVKGLRTGAADRNADGEIDAMRERSGGQPVSTWKVLTRHRRSPRRTPRTHRTAQDWVAVGCCAERSPVRLTTPNGRTGARRAALWAFSNEPTERPRNTSVAAQG